jgi:hypothetical protein
MIGKKISSEVTPSSLIFHTMANSESGEESDSKIYILTDNREFTRPKYVGSARLKEETIEYAQEFGTEILDTSKRNWRPLDMFLPDNKGYYADIGAMSRYQSVVSYTNDKDFDLREVELRDKEV